MSERRRGATGWLGYQSLLFTLALIAILSALSGCGSGQTDVGQTNGNSVPVNLNISMPQESAAASTRGSRFWATVQSWLPSLSNAWAATADLRKLTVEVTTEDLQPLTTKTVDIPQPATSRQVISIDLDVPVGPNRIFVVSGLDSSGVPILHGKSNPVTLISGQAASVEVILTDNTTGTVTGIVTNEGTGAPLSGATVTVNNLSTTTNNTGVFTLNGVSQGTQTLRVSASGFINTTKAVTVVAGSSVSAGTIALKPVDNTGTVTGTVINEKTGASLPNATVTVNGTTLSTTTLDNGTFTLHGILRGRQTLTISASGFTSTTRDVTITAGASVSAGTIALTPVDNTGTVTGTVINAETGTPLFRATVTVNGTTLSTTTLDNGTFTLHGILRGRQTLTISASGFTSTTRDVTITAGASVSAGTIALTPLPPIFDTVPGTVTHALTGRPIPNASVRIVNTSLQTSTDTNGSFTLNDVPQGSHTIEASAIGFITNSVRVNVVVGQTPTVGISLGPVTLEPGQIRIILNWGTTPRDLDSHLVVPTTPTPTEICFSQQGTLTGSPFAQLDNDERFHSDPESRLGPETITIAAPNAAPPPRFSGTYRYFVRNFTQEALLTSSGASIQVLNDTTEIARFTVPTTGTGRDWEVFTLDGATGSITPVEGSNGRITTIPTTQCQGARP